MYYDTTIIIWNGIITEWQYVKYFCIPQDVTFPTYIETETYKKRKI